MKKKKKLVFLICEKKIRKKKRVESVLVLLANTTFFSFIETSPKILSTLQIYKWKISESLSDVRGWEDVFWNLSELLTSDLDLNFFFVSGVSLFVFWIKKIRWKNGDSILWSTYTVVTYTVRVGGYAFTVTMRYCTQTTCFCSFFSLY